MAHSSRDGTSREILPPIIVVKMMPVLLLLGIHMMYLSYKTIYVWERHHIMSVVLQVILRVSYRILYSALYDLLI